MVHNQTTNFRNLAAQFFLGSIALALVTLAFFRIHVDLASTTFAYLIVIVLFSPNLHLWLILVRQRTHS
jgi:hypothetical protein